MKKFIFSKLADLQAGNFTIKWTLLHRVFLTAFKAPPCSPHVLTLSPHQILKSLPQCSQHLWETLLLSQKSHLLSFLRVCIPHEHLRGFINCFLQFNFQTLMILFPEAYSIHILINIYLRIITKRSDFLFILFVNIRHQNTSYLF